MNEKISCLKEILNAINIRCKGLRQKKISMPLVVKDFVGVIWPHIVHNKDNWIRKKDYPSGSFFLSGGFSITDFSYIFLSGCSLG